MRRKYNAFGIVKSAEEQQHQKHHHGHAVEHDLKLAVKRETRGIYTFCGCRRNERRETNDNFIGDYQSIYTPK